MEAVDTLFLIGNHEGAAGTAQLVGQCPALEPFIETGFTASEVVQDVGGSERKAGRGAKSGIIANEMTWNDPRRLARPASARFRVSERASERVSISSSGMCASLAYSITVDVAALSAIFLTKVRIATQSRFDRHPLILVEQLAQRGSSQLDI